MACMVCVGNSDMIDITRQSPCIKEGAIDCCCTCSAKRSALDGSTTGDHEETETLLWCITALRLHSSHHNFSELRRRTASRNGEPCAQGTGDLMGAPAPGAFSRPPTS